jgi:2-deoxy-D-gluconate 3-dehydrogenase
MANAGNVARLFDLRGKVAVVTGGNRGIGRSLALALAGAGAAVAIIARDDEKNRATLAELRTLGVAAEALRVDLADRAALKPALDTITKTVGPIEILVNNAAFAILKGVLDQTVEEWDSVLSVNLDAAFILAKYVAESMVARQHVGKIINVSSIAGNAGSPIFPSYVTAKGVCRRLHDASRLSSRRTISRSMLCCPDGSAPT